MFWLSKHFDLRSHIFFVVGGGEDGRLDLSVVANLYYLSGVKIPIRGLSDF